MRSIPNANNYKGPIKVLFVSHGSGMWGAERSLLFLLKNLNRDLFEPIVVLPRNGPLEEKMLELNIKIYEVASPWWVRIRNHKDSFIRRIIQQIKAIVRLYKIIEKEKIDIIYTNTIVHFSGAITAFITKRPHIWHIREILPGNPDLKFFLPHRILFTFISKSSDKIIANSKATTSQFKGMDTNSKLSVIYNAQERNESDKHNSLNCINGVEPADWLVTVVGTLQKGKAQDDAIRAIKIAQRVITNIKLLLIGDGQKEHKDYLKNLCLELDISERIVFTGYRDDVPQILPHCKLLLMPSWKEPFGRVVIEAMAACVPVIGANNGGVKEIIQDGITGYLVPPKNPAEIAKKMIYLFHHPLLAQQMGNNGKKVVEEKFSVQNYTRGVENIIREVVNIRCKRLGSLNVKRASSIN